jgi:hypothetical protein
LEFVENGEKCRRSVAIAQEKLGDHVEILRGRLGTHSQEQQWLVCNELFECLTHLGHCRRFLGDHQAAKAVYAEVLSFGFEAMNADSKNTNLK